MNVTNRCLFCGVDDGHGKIIPGPEPTGWIACEIERLPSNFVAFKAASGYCSARADGSVTLVPAIGPNETFTYEDGGNTASTVIGEGPRVVGVSA